MTVTTEKTSASFDAYESHTHDEDLRDFDFHAPVIKLGSKALDNTQEQPQQKIPQEEIDEPHEFNGFAD